VVTLETVRCAVCGSGGSSPARVRAPRDDHALVLGLEGGRSHWVVCDECGLVFQNPRPDADAVGLLYEGGSYHENRGGTPEHYVQYSLRRSRAAIAWGLEAGGLDPHAGKALDIGCGIGGALVELRRRGWDVVGIEPDEELGEVGRSRFDLEVRTGFFGADTIESGDEFDLAYSCHVWEHLADPLTVTRDAHRVLAAREGHLLIVVPTFRQARTLAWSCFTAPHMYMFTDVSLGNVLRQAGFDVVASRYAAAADSELWILAKARSAEPEPEHASVDVEDPAAVQRELMAVPLRIALGVPGRLATHVRTLTDDPADFARRLQRWTRARLGRARTSLTGRTPRGATTDPDGP
jgi:SAM-dependent methyltransferase